MADELGLSTTCRWARFFRARVAWMRGRLDVAERETRDLIEDAARTRDGSMAITSRRLLAETLLEQGRLDEADAVLEAAVDASVRTGDRWSRTELLAHRATIRVGAGSSTRRAISWRSPRSRSGPPTSRRLRGRGLARPLPRRRATTGRPSARSADAVARSRATEYWWWATDALDLAEFLASRGRLAEALRSSPRSTRRAALGYGIRRERSRRCWPGRLRASGGRAAPPARAPGSVRGAGRTRTSGPPKARTAGARSTRSGGGSVGRR